VSDTRLLFVGLRVRDLAASTRFYRDAFGVDGEASLPFTLVAADDDRATTNAHVGFLVDDLETAHARATGAGAAVVQPPSGESLTRTAAYHDPDGNLVTLTERARVSRVAGVDMAGGAWAVVVLEDDRIVDAFRCESFSDALLVDAGVIGVDIPIGIPDLKPRPADAAARKFVGPRASSVFTTPVRHVLEAATYAEARGVATELTGKSISAQTYALRKRILEVDEHAHGDERVIEVHPEVSFRELAHRPLPSKHRAEGLIERRRLLEDAGIELPESVPRVAEPDLLDATVVAWTARRYAVGQALPLPDGHGLRIGAIWR
jgi:predicted RNase H-like nuclease/predicted enzyme related to lactoylglutathione lyase